MYGKRDEGGKRNVGSRSLSDASNTTSIGLFSTFSLFCGDGQEMVTFPVTRFMLYFASADFNNFVIVL